VADRRRADAFVPLRALTVPALAPEAALAEIRRLYFRTSEKTIERDLSQAVALLTRLASEEDRERATVYMEGLTEMRKEWAPQSGGRGQGAGRRKKKPRTPD
jgi:hypothetical protein